MPICDTCLKPDGELMSYIVNLIFPFLSFFLEFDDSFPGFFMNVTGLSVVDAAPVERRSDRRC